MGLLPSLVPVCGNEVAFSGNIMYHGSMLTKRVKARVAGEFQKHEKDTGSAEVQVALLSRQIDELAAHLKKNPKDNHSRRGLLKMVSGRRKLLAYLKKKEPSSYEKVIKKLDLKR
jgi:small subunit ribosomal protein S15